MMSQFADLEPQLNQILDQHTHKHDLLRALDQFEAEHPGALTHFAAAWMPKAAQHGITYFHDYFACHLNPNQHRELIEQLLTHVSPRHDAVTHAMLYRLVADKERFNRDMLALASSDKSNQAMYESLEAYGYQNMRWVDRSYMKLTDEAATALFQRNPKLFHEFVEPCLHEKHFPYTRLSQAAYPLRDKYPTYWRIFRMTATAEEWDTELNRVIETRPGGKIEDMLIARHPDANHDMPETTFFRLIETFGEGLMGYFRRFSSRFGRKAIKTALETARNDDELLREMNSFRYQYRGALAKSVDVWAPALLKRNPAVFEKFLKHNVPRNRADVIKDLLPLIRANGQLDLYQTFYGYIVNKDDWNGQIRDLLQRDQTPAELLYELDWLDVSEKVYLLDETAAALYQRDPRTFRDFIEAHLSISIHYARLREAAADDETFWWEIFRASATAKMWQAEMAKLLEAAVPAENIAAELEKRHPTNNAQPDPTILAKFLEKYGAAALPYMEKHVQLLTRDRLKSLLALDIERGDLRRELETLANRQPGEFENMADLWFPALYDPDSDFFDNFMLRHTNWVARRDHRQVLRDLLPRMEADGKNRLFSQVYEMVTDEDEWARDIRRMIASDLSDDELLAALGRRRSWFRLPGKEALILYQRNRDVFHDFIRSTVNRYSHRRNQGEYADLLKLARQYDDTPIIQAVSQSSVSGVAWRDEVQTLIDAPDMPAADVLTRLRELQPAYTYDLLNHAHLVIELLERYGEPLLNYVLENSSWIVRRRNKDRETVLRIARESGTETQYWQAFFQVAGEQQWNDELTALLDRNLPPDEFFFELDKRTPPPARNRWRSGWSIYDEVSVRIHAIDPQRAYPLLTQYAAVTRPTLIAQAEAMGDDRLLNFITYREMVQWNSNAERQQWAVKRLLTLYDESPEQYVRHAASILGQIRAFEIWGGRQVLSNPIFDLVTNEHHDDWLRSTDAMRDLLESPSIYVQIMALTILSGGGDDAAQRTLENLFLLRAFLLSRAKVNSKAKALQCLENAVLHSPENAAKILPVLEAALDYEGKRAIREKALATYGRVKRAVAEKA